MAKKGNKGEEEGKKNKFKSNVLPGKNIVAYARANNVRISPRKVRLVLDLIRGKDINLALRFLVNSNTKAARIVRRVLQDAAANARDFGYTDMDALWVIGAFAGEGRCFKRVKPRARGRADVIKKRSSNITLVLGEA
ncbi:MAG: 50S ribosomal protein L22 [Candidatus Dadabacteria bacterium]|nr:MAG: 50S ribosomal protein L22 [Candidatus Dadabacteria bacterium]